MIRINPIIERYIMKRVLIPIFLFSCLLFIASTPRVSSLLLETLETLSSDSLEGRQPGTPGSDKAVAYLEEKLTKLKLAGLGRGGFKQGFTIFTKMEKTGENFFKTKEVKAEKFQPLSMSMSGSLKESELVFVGYGISIPKSDQNLIYDDYDGVDVKGKTVIFMTGDPAIGNGQSKFRDPAYITYRTLFYKMRNALAHGASGAILVGDPMSLTGQEEDPFFDDREGGGDRMDLLAGQVTISSVDSLLEDRTLKSYQKELSTSQKPISFYLNKKANLSVHLEKKTGRVSNLMAYLPGTDPILKKEVIVIGAHMDHLGYGGPSSLGDRRVRAIHNGADDNASGSALVMDLLSELKDKGLKRSVVAVFFNAEEIGLLGSAHFVSSWSRYEGTYGKIKAMLNFDMVGRLNKKVQIMAADSAPEWMETLKSVDSADKGLFEFLGPSVGSSDHASFAAAKIPVLFFTTGGHDDYHRPSDDSHKIDYSGLMKIRGFAEALVTKIDESDQVLTFNPNFSMGSGSGRNRGYGAHLGCVPKFGQSDDIVGVLCTGTSPHSPAEGAGVLAGDILTKIGEIEIKSIYDLAFALKYYRAGDKILLKWKRGVDAFEKEILLIRKGNKSLHSCHFPLLHEL
jgi:aminopeptidase YwaD